MQYVPEPRTPVLTSQTRNRIPLCTNVNITLEVFLRVQTCGRCETKSILLVVGNKKDTRVSRKDQRTDLFQVI